jgi:hypothetical protein
MIVDEEFEQVCTNIVNTLRETDQAENNCGNVSMMQFRDVLLMFVKWDEEDKMHVMNKMNDVFPDRLVEYERIPEHFREIRGAKLAERLFELEQTPLEKFLIEHFKGFDGETIGKLTREQLTDGLKKCPEFHLNVFELHVLASLCTLQGQFNYYEDSYLIASYVYQIFRPKIIKRKV